MSHYKMDLFTKEKKNNKIIFKFLGIPYCWKVINQFNNRYKKSYFNGLIKTSRKFYALHYILEHKINVFNINVLNIKEDGEYRYYYLRKFLLKKENLKKILKRTSFKYIDKKHDHVYILNANSGETYLFLSFVLDALIKKNGDKNPLLIATQLYHNDLVKLICPDIPHIYVKSLYRNIKDDNFTMGQFKFTKIFSNEHFLKVEDALRKDTTNQAHYFSYILDTLKIPQSEIGYRKIKTNPEITERMLEKVSKTGLDTNNFVFIAPEACSCELLDNKFWVDLIKSLQAEGYDIFVNLATRKVRLKGVEYKSCKLTFSEAFELVKMSKKVYTLRSGFTEFLLDTNVPMTVYYTKFRNNNITAEQIHSGFGLMKIPSAKPELITEVVFS